MQQELKLRIISGIILAAIVLAATWYGGLAFRALSSLIGLLIYYEWSAITGLQREQPAANVVGWAWQGAIALAILLERFDWALGALLALFLVAIGFVVLRGVSRWFPAGVVYAGLTGIALKTLGIVDSDLISGLVATAMGLAIGSGATWAFRVLDRRESNSVASEDDPVGKSGRILVAVAPGSTA